MKRLDILYFVLIAIILSGCQARFTDISSRTISTKILSLEENSIVTSSVWLSDNVIVFTVDDSDRKTPNPFIVYNIKDQSWKEIVLPTNPTCQVNGFGFLESLPDGNIGFVNTCIDKGNETRLIDKIDVSTGKTKDLMDVGPIEVAGKFSFSPDMTELVQEDMIGRFLSNKLYFRNAMGDTQIVPNFTRAMYPDWSPHKRQIAFWGTQNYPGKEPEDFTKLPEILDLSSYPWDLYISTPEGTDITKVFSSVEDPLVINWSPTKDVIVFSGTIDGSSGVFLLDLETSEILRIWPKLSDADWSPDGTRILIVSTEKGNDGKIKNQDINIVDIR